jgi:hypothetical protein
MSSPIVNHRPAKKSDHILPIPNPPVVTIEEVLTLAEQDEIELQTHKSRILSMPLVEGADMST